MNRFELKHQQQITYRKGKNSVGTGIIHRLNRVNAVVEDVATKKMYNVPYSIIVSAGDVVTQAAGVSITPAVSGMPYAAKGDTVEIVGGTHSGEQYKVTDVNRTRYVVESLLTRQVYTIPFRAVKVVLTAEEKKAQRHSLLSQAGMTDAQVKFFETLI